MRLRTRLALAMVLIAVVTTVTVGAISLHQTRQALVSAELDRLAVKARNLASELETYANAPRVDIRGLLGAPAIGGIVRSLSADGVDPTSGVVFDAWKSQLADTFHSEMLANPAYLQLRLIGIADDGREVVRVNRTEAGGPVRVVSEAELQRKGSRPYFRQAIETRHGAIYISPVELNREAGEIQEPPTPVLRAATSIRHPASQPWGILIIDLDMRPIFKRLRSEAQHGEIVYVIDEQDEFLLHPSPERTFRFEYGESARWQREFPEPAAFRPSAEPAAHVTRDAEAQDVVVARAEAVPEDGPRLTVLVSVPHAQFLTPVQKIERNILVGAAAVCVLALIIALVLAGTLTKPLKAMTAAILAFSRGERLPFPTSATGEVGVLARAFEHFAARERLYGAAVESSDDAIWTITPEGIITSANQAATRLYGYAPGELIGYNAVSLIVPEERRAESAELFERVRRGERIANFETVRLDKAGRLIDVALTVSPIKDATGEIVGAATFARDITERRKMQEQLHQSQKMEAVGQLTGGVAHDFNNLLTVVIGNAQLLAKLLRDAKQLALVNRILSAGDRGAALTRSLLAFGRRQMLETRAVDVNLNVTNVQKLASRILGEDVELTTALAPDLPKVHADPAQLESALLNLLVNARDAMSEGGKIVVETSSVKIDAGATASQFENIPAGSYVLLAVSDTGEGMPPEVLTRAFEPFFTTKAEGKGTGLGLSMVYGLVRQLGGEARIYSQVGHGTTVKLYLPLAEQEELAAAEEILPEVVAARGERILLVEDDDLVREMARDLLEDLGYHVVMAADANDAMSLLEEKGPFDLLFTDMIMPGGMTGMELAEKAAARWPEIRVLFASGYTERASRQMAGLELNAILLTKPYQRSELQRRLRQAIEGQTYAESSIGAA